MKWTQGQQEVIDARGCNLLVSAAAGSGKTAVLVERIINLICDEENPVDIDRLLVMTFTNGAAGEMRERISKAIEAKLAEDPGREHLQVQAALVHRAQITTIDSFCLSLIRDHFNLLDIDPAFRIGEEGELMLLRAEVMEDMLEEYYGKDDPVFRDFVETYAAGKSDSGIEDYIMQVYTFSQSNPFPEEWLDRCRGELLDMEEGELDGTAWMGFLMEDVRKQAGELAGQLEGAMEVCRMEGGPGMYLPTLQTELEMVRGIGAAKDYETLYDRLQAASFGRMAAARGKDIDKEKKEYASACRDRVKKAVKSLAQLYGQQSPGEAVEDILGGRDVVLKLLELAGEFHRRYQEGKRDKNIVDFNDLEHEALRILVKKEDGKISYTAVADELSQRYAEILVDEYQDSNDVQETLIQSLSAERFGRPNVFMVGDVKQSIYKFRLARPELFMRKYECYGEYGEAQAGGGKEGMGGISGKKIELCQNFRSRASVLNSINEVFFQIMTKNLGNIQYTDKVALHAGAEFEKTGEKAGTPTELLLVDTGAKTLGPDDGELEEYTSREIEARLIASRIRELTDAQKGLSVWDKEKGCYRRARYGDMVILLRSLTGWTDSFLNVLTQEDIPAFAETGTGYFDTIEVETVLAMLAVIDNPIQDIPLATVLKSPMVGMDDEELAWLMAVWKHDPRKGQDRGLYGALRLVVLGNEPEPCPEMEDREPDKWDGQGEDKEETAQKWENLDIKEGKSGDKWERQDIKTEGNRGRRENEDIKAEESGGVKAGWNGGKQENKDIKAEGNGAKGENGDIKAEGNGAKGENGDIKAGGNRNKWGNRDIEAEENGSKWEIVSIKAEEMGNGWGKHGKYGEEPPNRQEDNEENKEKWEDRRIFEAITGKGWGNIPIDWEKSESKWGKMAESLGIPEVTAGSVYKKAAAFTRLLGELRSQAVYLPIHELIHRMYLRTGYYDYVSAMPAGEVRRANLDMLIEKASSYEKTSYKGLFHFIRYIEKLKKYDTDFGEATAAGKSQEMVRLMSIHKSKGLEFPIVFLAGMGKNFNKQDIRGKLLIDVDLGIGADYFNVETRVRVGTLKKNVLKRKMDLDNLGEELRVLYVAMTRAKEKLVMTGTDRYLEKKLERWHQRTWEAGQVPYTILSTAGSYLDWMLMCRLEESPLFSVREIPVETLVGEAVARKIEKEVSKEELKNLDLSVVYDKDMEGLLKERLSYQYPYGADIGLHTKISVSELKKKGQDIDDKNSLFQPVVPEFLREAGAGREAGGASRGSAYHRILELLDFPAMAKEEDVTQWMQEACKEGRITKDTADMVEPGRIWGFLQSSMGKRMGLAQREGRLHREQQFVMGIPAEEMGLGKSKELVLIQGIIDAWMEEDGGLVLVDYKTDRVGFGKEEVLVKRYKVQLDYYKRALEQMVKKPVKERVIYSLALQKEIPV